MFNKKLGKLGEEIAADFLVEKKYKLIEKNFSQRGGEIDLICKKGKQLIFIEVKTRTSALFGSPEEAITEDKLAKIESTAQAYCQQKNYGGAWKIEAVSIIINSKQKSVGINHLTEL